MIRHVLFDLDGTLTDSGEGITRCMAHAVTALGLPCPEPAELTRFIGVPLGACFGVLLDTSDEAQILEAIRLYRERFAERGMYENRVYPGIPEALASLRALGYELWVVTAKPQYFAEKILDHFRLARHFRGTFGPPLDGERRDKTGIIRDFLKNSGLPPMEAVMVGDRGDDVQGARANDLAAVGVLWGYGTREELEQARPDGMVKSPGQLADLLRRLEGRP